jgi:hypothetical protein
MVSSAVNLTVEELVERLRQFQTLYADDPDWQQRRSQFPEDWPF